MPVQATGLPRGLQALLFATIATLTAASCAPYWSVIIYSDQSPAPSTSSSTAQATAVSTSTPTLQPSPASSPSPTGKSTQAPSPTAVVRVCAGNPCLITMRDQIAYGVRSIKVGTKVTWTSACFAVCTVTFKTIPVDSGPMSKGDTFSHVFEEPGSYDYYCQFDPAEMKGTIIVTS